MPDDEPRETREPREQPLRNNVCADLPPPINTEPAKPRRVYIRNSVELVRHGNIPGCIGCEAAMIQGPSRDFTEQCRTRIIQAMSSDADLSARVRDGHERMSRSVSDAEPNKKKVRFAEHTTVQISPAISTPQTQCLHLLRMVERRCSGSCLRSSKLHSGKREKFVQVLIRGRHGGWRIFESSGRLTNGESYSAWVIIDVRALFFGSRIGNRLHCHGCHDIAPSITGGASPTMGLPRSGGTPHGAV